MWSTPAPPSTALVASSIWSGVGEVNTSPGHAASSMPRPTKPPCIGSWPEPPPGTKPTLPPPRAAARPTPRRPPAAASDGGCRAVAGARRRGVRRALEARLRRLGLGKALALPESAHLVHDLVPLLGVARADRPAEAHLDLVAARDEAARDASRPVLAGPHRLVGAAEVDRHDVDVVLGRDHRCARAHLAYLAVARARALREHHEVPTLVDQAVDVVGCAVAQPPALAAERHGVEQQRDAAGLPAAVVEVVGRRGHRGAGAPLARQRAQDGGGVQVARVVGDEDHWVLESVEHLAADGARAHVEVDQRPEPEAEQPLAGGLRIAAPRP